MLGSCVVIVATVIALLVVLAPNHAAASATFGYATSSAGHWVITTGAGLVATVNPKSCDLRSLVYRGQELQWTGRGTQLNSGLDAVTSSSISSFTSNGKAGVQVTCKITGLTHYIMFRPDENTIYMGTYHTADWPFSSSNGELRFIGRFSSKTLGSGPNECTVSGSTAFESTDIYKDSNGQTHSKYYSGTPFINDDKHYVYGSAGAAYLVNSPQSYEASTGGPFYRDIDIQILDNHSELSFYMASDHSRTEAYRYGFHGPYALAFTDGGAPSNVDFGFVQTRNLTGFVPDSNRCRLSGSISDPNGVLQGSNTVVHWFNAAAQYWTKASSDLSFTSPSMIPGTYNVIVYKKEMPVATSSVTVSKSSCNRLSIAVSYVDSKPLWRIGDWDGTPDGFLNADKIHRMHPSDSRMASWKPLTFDVSKNQNSEFPMALFRAVNSPLRLRFDLTSQQAAATHRLRVGVTLAESSARPSIQVNSKWNGPVLATKSINSRGVTRGVTHGNYFVYEYDVPSTAWIVGSNNVSISIASGETDPTDAPFLSASIVFDAIELV